MNLTEIVNKITKLVIRSKKEGNGGSIRLKNGQSIHIRAIGQTDIPAIQSIYDNLSEESQYLRFNSLVTAAFIRKVAAQTIQDCISNGSGILAYLIEADGTEKTIGHARYVLMDDNKAEICLAIRDNYQGLGLGKFLLKQLIELAKAENVDELVAFVNRHNKSMQALLYKMSLPIFSDIQSSLSSFRLILNSELLPQLDISF